MSVGSTIMRMRQAKSSLNSTNVRHMARVSLDLVLVGWKNMSDRKVRETRHKKRLSSTMFRCNLTISLSSLSQGERKRSQLKPQHNHWGTFQYTHVMSKGHLHNSNIISLGPGSPAIHFSSIDTFDILVVTSIWLMLNNEPF
jgi:DNA-binding transcriptional regulator YiaG